MALEKKTCKSCVCFAEMVDRKRFICEPLPHQGEIKADYRQICEYHERKRGRRGNLKVDYDNYTFDGLKEYEQYRIYKDMEEKGEITDLVIKPVFILQEAFDDDYGRHRAITYEADYSHYEGKVFVVTEVKGHETRVYQIKRDWFLYQNRFTPNWEFRVVRV